MPPASPTAIPEPFAARRAEHDALLERARALLEADDRVAAAWLFGSRGRGDADALSDIDLVIVAHDAHLETLKRERREFVSQLGAPLLIQDLPRNAPPGGAYLLVLYPGETGPLQVDWYWRALSGSAVPHDARLLLDRTGITVPRQPPPPEPAADERAIDLSRDVIIFWAMAPIAAKYIARRRPAETFNLLRMMTNALERVRRSFEPGIGAQPVPEPIDRWRGALTVNAAEQLATLRRLCNEMASLTPSTPPLHPTAGTLTEDAPQHVLRFIDAVERLLPHPLASDH